MKIETAAALALVVFAAVTGVKFCAVKSNLTVPPPMWSADGGEVDTRREKNSGKHKYCSGSKSTITGEDEPACTETAAYERNARNPSPAAALWAQRTDLAAQRGMWRATNALVELTLWQLWIGFIGLATIGLTLFETRRTANAAIKAANVAENAERAHVYAVGEVDFVFNKPTQDDVHHIAVGDPWQISLKFSIQNFGKTPATNINCTTNVYRDASSTPFDHKKNVDVLQAGKLLPIGQDAAETLFFISESDNERPIARVIIEYDDIFGNKCTPSESLFYIEFEYQGGIATLDDTARNSKKLVRSFIESIERFRIRTKHNKSRQDKNS